MQACPECGRSSPDGVRFCASCGHALADDAPVTSRDEELAPGSVLGIYRLLDVIGEGGMGRVYLAEHTRLGRRVALKMLRPKFAVNPVAVARFFAEARAVNRISHENIVEITDFFEKTGGDNYYIMEFLRGEDLSQVLLRETVLPLDRAVYIMMQVARAMAAVHAAGIVHRDLKPDNVFLINRSNKPDFVKLLDFGVAKLSRPASQGGIKLGTTEPGAIIGTPEYMSPEQAGGIPVDHRTDVYALGVMLYELIVGQLPFEAASFGEMVIKHMTVPPKPPSAHDGLPHAIPTGLEDLTLQMLSKDAESRPQAMTEIEARLKGILGQLRESEDSQLIHVSTRTSGVHKLPPAPPRRLPALPRPATRDPVPATVTRVGSGPSRKAARELERLPPAVPPVAIERPIDAAAVARPVEDESSEPAMIVGTPLLLDPVPELAAQLEPSAPVASQTASMARVRPRGHGGLWLAITMLVLAGGGAGAWYYLQQQSGPTAAEAAPAPPPPEVAPPTPTAPEPAPAPTPPVAAEVTIQFASNPAGAEVRIAGEPAALGTTPFTHAFPRSTATTTFEFSLAGHTSATQQIALATDGAIAAALTAIPVATARPRPARPVKKPRPGASSVDKGGTMDVFDD